MTPRPVPDNVGCGVFKTKTMEEKHTYYTPTIEEFHVGFQYEEDFMSGDGDWRKVTFEVKDDDLWHIPGKLEEGWIRVRHLCHEDIVGLGFNEIVPNHQWAGNLFGVTYVLTKSEETFQIIKGAGINAIIKGEYLVLFLGTIRNSSELKRIMKMVGIEK